MINLKEAMFYKKMLNDNTQCLLCPHNCIIAPLQTGRCGVRKNINGILYSLIFEQVSSISLDPIEKKPLNNFYPGSKILSVGSIGCNFRCPFCQNYSIVGVRLDEAKTIRIKSYELVQKAIEEKRQGNIGIAYTYNEPTIWYEYIYETARMARTEGLVNVLVTNGYINREPLETILPFIDAMNIDLKAYDDDFYKNIVKGSLEEVLTTIEISAKKCHVEITTLVIPGLNDSVDEMAKMSKWIASISPDISLHLSRFFPKYKMTDIRETSVKTLNELQWVALKYLNNVYIGNI